MINILLPAMGNSMFFKDYYFPKLMLEIGGETVLEKIIGNYANLREKHFVFVLNQKDCMDFHIDKSAKIITDSESSIIILKNQTGGALCTCLLAIKEINTNEPLVIANCDQIIDVDDIRLAHLNEMFVELLYHIAVDGTLQRDAVVAACHDDFPYTPFAVVYEHSDVLDMDELEIRRVGV